ncbi:MAG: ferritin-like domain-containing protein [Pseudomonadota bacterium]
MSTTAKLGMNYTGMQMSPKDSEKLMDAVNEVLPDVPGDEGALASERGAMVFEADRIGSVALPGSAKGMLKSGLDKLRGKSPELLIDKLGERLAFERTGVRLYEAVLAKASVLEFGDADDLTGVFKQIRDEEAEHMTVLVEALEHLGADPTSQTPCADVAGVTAMGVMQVLTDPRTNLAQSLNALLTVELTDNAAWELLIDLAEAAGHDGISQSFQLPLAQEREHLVKIKSLLKRELIRDVA